MQGDILAKTEQLAVVAAYAATLPADDKFFLSTAVLPSSGLAVIGDVVQPADPWYAGATPTVAYQQVQNDPDQDGSLLIRTNLFQFNWAATGGAGPSTIRASGVMNAAGTALKWYRNLEEAVTLANAEDSINVQGVAKVPALLGN